MSDRKTFDYWPTPTGVRFHASPARTRVVIGPVGCLPGWTEVMTPHGWTRIDSWRNGDKLLEWSHETREAAFRKPRRYIVGECGSMLEILCGRRFGMTMSQWRRTHAN